MTVTQIDLDDEALAEADYVARVRRLEAAERLAARGERGEFDAAAAAYSEAKRARRAAFE
ncbi:type II toxin-antitoxin system VapB family antitoxin [Streptomyces sp. VNUA24]|uniref:type II toxin-antitoxin system VapB family antitoxin n=1 Tax=Streptomyces sp. VNUA24 TaxID=3031131 RepID=UPI0023B83E04|nr:type II toxin-antitoxin system VapB family antitoxin [Streptomyces sp. VNUA24]WEH17755.1 type II toxin-antitoxin system VapB family antitoxin [Streptomyces sp. VNUA24]